MAALAGAPPVLLHLRHEVAAEALREGCGLEAQALELLLELAGRQSAHVVDAGYSPSTAALAVGLVGLFGSAGAILCGFISDRIGREPGYTMGGSAAIVGILLLLFVRDTSSPWMLYGYGILFGLGYGSSGSIGAAATADLFPGNSLGRILGTTVIWWGLGAALGAYLGGYFHDRVGSYTLPFLLVLISICLGILGIWMAAPRHRRTPSVSQAG